MSNFKEIYPQKNFREDLHRMDSLGEDNYEVWAYNGEPNYAPLSADYAYELVRNTKTISGTNIVISDAINMPTESFKLYGESAQSGVPTMSSPKNFTKIGIYNPSTNYYEIKCYTQQQSSDKELIYSPQPLMSLPSGIRDEYDNGCLYLRTVYDYFKNTDNWQLDTVRSNSNVTIISLFTKKAVNDSIDLWCTHFKPDEDLSQPNRIRIENQRIYISASVTDCPDLDSFLRWMGNNQVYICYPRKGTLKVMSEPSVLLYTCEGRTEIVNDQNAEMEIEYRVAPNARVWKKQEDGTFTELTS